MMLKVGVGVGLGAGCTKAPEQVPLYDPSLRVTVQGAPFSSAEFIVNAGEVAA
jgi:hypothetical protein